MLQIDLNCRKIFEVFVFLMQFLYIFREISFQIPTQSTPQRKNELCIAVLKRTLHCFASKTLQIDSKEVEKFQHFRFCATCVVFESFWG